MDALTALGRVKREKFLSGDSDKTVHDFKCLHEATPPKQE